MHSTSNINDGYLGSGNRIRRSINKHGKENFKCEILELLPDRKSLKKREKELVNEDILKDKMCMNLQPGGGGGFVNEEHKRNFRKGASNYLKNKWKDKDYREKINKVLRNNIKESHRLGKIKYDTFTGKKHSEDTKQKMRKTKNNGNSNSQFGSCWITNGKENKKIKKEDKIPNGWKLGRIIIF